jgi:hypothetical protein
MDATENSSIEARLDKYNETSTVVMNACMPAWMATDAIGASNDGNMTAVKLAMTIETIPNRM